MTSFAKVYRLPSSPLIKRNLVVKKKSRKDLRIVMLKLTKEGKIVHDRIHRCLISFVRAIQAEIPDYKRDACLEGIHVFLDAMKHVSEKRPVTISTDTCLRLL